MGLKQRLQSSLLRRIGRENQYHAVEAITGRSWSDVELGLGQRMAVAGGNYCHAVVDWGGNAIANSLSLRRAREQEQTEEATGPPKYLHNFGLYSHIGQLGWQPDFFLT